MSLGVGSEHYDPFLLLCHCGAGSQNDSLITPLPNPTQCKCPDLKICQTQISPQTLPNPTLTPNPRSFTCDSPHLKAATDLGKTAHPMCHFQNICDCIACHVHFAFIQNAKLPWKVSRETEPQAATMLMAFQQGVSDGIVLPPNCFFLQKYLMFSSLYYFFQWVKFIGLIEMDSDLPFNLQPHACIIY